MFANPLPPISILWIFFGSPLAALMPVVPNIEIGGKGVLEQANLEMSFSKNQNGFVCTSDFPLIPPRDGLRFKGIPFTRSI